MTTLRTDEGMDLPTMTIVLADGTKRLVTASEYKQLVTDPAMALLKSRLAVK